MQFRFPWILSRRRLVVAAVADGTLFAFIYYALYEWFFGILPGFSLQLAALLLIWSLASYVIGRYSFGVESGYERHAWNLVGKHLIRTGFVLFLTLGVTLLQVWVFSQNLVQESFGSFLTPFLLSLAISSSVVQLIIRRFLIIQDLDRNSDWLYVGSNEDCQQLQEMLKWSRIQVCIRYVTPGQLGKVASSKYIVDHFHDQPSDLLDNLYRFQQQGSVVLNRLSWCELVLQRFPSELLSQADLLDGGFTMPRGTLQSRLKRIGDIVVASSLLVVTSPLVLVSALLIKISDKGPVFYSQVRTGLNGNPYRIWKLRTMRMDAEAMAHSGQQDQIHALQE